MAVAAQFQVVSIKAHDTVLVFMTQAQRLQVFQLFQVQAILMVERCGCMELKEKIVDVATGQETWREYTAEEIAKVEAAKAELAAERAEIIANQEARKAILEKLGLSADEIATLGL